MLSKIRLILALAIVILFAFCNKEGGKDSDNSKKNISWTGNVKKVYSEEVVDGNTEIFAADYAGNIKRLTSSPSRDEAPTLSPDKTKIAFNSDRDGEPAIYVMDCEGNILRRLTSLRNIDLLSRENRWKDNEQLITWEVRGWKGYDTQRDMRIYQVHREYVNVNTGESSGIRVETYSEGTGQLLEVK